MHKLQADPLPIKWVEKIFQQLHGRFGNPFMDKFRIGELNDEGNDIGVENAKATWSSRLAGMSPERIKAALDYRYQFAPNCDDFQAQCVIKHEIQDYKAIDKKIDIEASRANLEKLNGYIAENTKPANDMKAWAKRIIANPKNYPSISLTFAQEALANNGMG